MIMKMNKLDYTCSIADPERELNMLFEFWGSNPIGLQETKKITTSLTDTTSVACNNPYGSTVTDHEYCRPSTHIQEFISVDVLPSGFVWEVSFSSYDGEYFSLFQAVSKKEIAESLNRYYKLSNITIKCIGLASNYAHYADELNMKVIEGIVCDYE